RPSTSRSAGSRGLGERTSPRSRGEWIRRSAPRGGRATTCPGTGAPRLRPRGRFAGREPGTHERGIEVQLLRDPADLEALFRGHEGNPLTDAARTRGATDPVHVGLLVRRRI